MNICILDGDYVICDDYLVFEMTYILCFELWIWYFRGHTWYLGLGSILIWSQKSQSQLGAHCPVSRVYKLIGWRRKRYKKISGAQSETDSLPGLQVNRVKQTNSQIYKYTNIQIYKSTNPVSPVCKLIGWSRRQKSYSNTSLLTFPILLPPFYCVV